MGEAGWLTWECESAACGGPPPTDKARRRTARRSRPGTTRTPECRTQFASGAEQREHRGTVEPDDNKGERSGPDGRAPDPGVITRQTRACRIHRKTSERKCKRDCQRIDVHATLSSANQVQLARCPCTVRRLRCDPREGRSVGCPVSQFLQRCHNFAVVLREDVVARRRKRSRGGGDGESPARRHRRTCFSCRPRAATTTLPARAVLHRALSTRSPWERPCDPQTLCPVAGQSRRRIRRLSTPSCQTICVTTEPPSENLKLVGGGLS